MNSPSKVSVVCAWYNRADYICDTLDSLLAQDFDGFEIVLINDGSPDPRVRQILDGYKDPRLKVIHQENSGFTVAIRRAIDLATAPFIAIQGSGDISLPGRLGRQWEAFQQDSSLGIVGCEYSVRDMTNSTVKRVKPVCPVTGDLKFVGLSHGELMYRKSAYEAVGGYRTAFHVGQGSDLWMRIMRRHSAFIIPVVAYEQRYFADGVAKSIPKRAARHAMNAARMENERIFRQTGFDHIDTYGPAAFAILGGRINVRLAIAYASVAINSDWGNCEGVRLDAGALSSALSVIYRMRHWRKKRKTALLD